MPQAYQTHLLIVQDDKGEREFSLDKETYSIGRDPTCEIRLISQFVSRRHATLARLTDEPFTYRITDGEQSGGGSANGLLINGRKLRDHTLKNGDEVVFGPGVKAIYRFLKSQEFDTEVPHDPFDITLISPGMIGEPEDDVKPSAAAN
jgi:pSer/pThr/pTyr-binding forkhead associated (FHA) protein